MSPVLTDRRASGMKRLTLSALISLLIGGCGSLVPQAEDVGKAYPAATTTRYAKALEFMDAGDDTRAVIEFEEFRSRYPDYSGPSVNLGIIHGRNGRPDAAMAAFQRALSNCTACAVAYNQMGILQRRQGEFASAEASYQKAIAADPGYALAYYNLGVLYDLYQGRLDLALKYYQGYVQHRADESTGDAVDKWIIDLQRRVGKTEPGSAPEASG
jgi:Tfp pilus assembly protein PilF